MNAKNLLLFVFISLALFGAANSQTPLFVNEEKSSVVFAGNSADFALQIENPDKTFTGKVSLELLDTEGKIRARTLKNEKIKKGVSNPAIKVMLGDLLKQAEDELAWYRLRYKIVDANNSLQTEGIVSLSELIRDIFELRVSATERVYKGTTYRARVRAAHPFTGLPVKNVKIEGEVSLDLDTEDDEDELKITAKGKTGADGFTVLDFKIPDNISIEYADELKITGSKYGLSREVSEDLDADNETDSFYINTDKPIYQPGQTLNVRGILLRNSAATNTVVTDSKLEFFIKDGSDSLLYKETVKTSRFGIAAISWTIPENAKLGEYRIEVEDEDGDTVGSERIKVTRYDLPQFTVTAKAERDFYLAQDAAAKITISADYLFGKPVAKGKVRVVEEGERRWDYRNQKWLVSEGRTIEGESDADGKFIAEIDIRNDHDELARKGWRRYKDLSFAAYFTDLTTNRTEQKRFDIRLTKEAIHIYFIGETYNQNPKLPLTYYISTFYADGTPAECETEITGKFENEAAAEKLIGKVKTNSFGAGKLEFTAPRNSDIEKDLLLKISAIDSKGQTGTHDERIDFDAGDQLKIKTEKTIFRKGDAIKAEIFSTKEKGLVYIDLVKDWSVIYSGFAELENYRTEVKIPYQNIFKGDLTLAAYMENYDAENEYSSLIKRSRGIIFPAPTNLSLDAKFSQTVYRPNEEGRINFSVISPEKIPVESALGVVIFDKAIEERARTDAEFGSYNGMFYGLRSLLGYEKSFGGLSLRDLNEIDLRRPISEDLQLAADVLLYESYYYPNIYRSNDEGYDRARNVFSDFFDKQFTPVETALKNSYLKDFSYPRNDEILRKILFESGIDFQNLRDPWLMPYRTEYTVEEKDDIVNIKSAGADKKFDTKDDFTVLKMGFEYFLPIGRTIDKTGAEYVRQTEKFIRDYATLKNELKKFEIDPDNLKDRWNRTYRVEFKVDGRRLKTLFHSAGADGIFEEIIYYNDDFIVWTSEFDYFADTEKRIQKILSENKNISFPQTEAEFRKLLQENDFNFGEVKDAFGQKVYLTINKYARYADKIKVENARKVTENSSQKTTVEPVTQQVVTLKIRSAGADLTEATEDDFDLASFSGIVSEQGKQDEKPKPFGATLPMQNASGAIRGTITDPNGAVVPGAVVTAKNKETENEYSAESNDEGIYIIENLPAGKYEVYAEAPGFQRTALTDVPVRSKLLTEADMTLQVAGVTMTVDVQSGVTTLETASTLFGYGRGRGSGSGDGSGGGGGGGREEEKDVSENQLENSTPRLREYFPETLVWNPELITDKNGKAELKFKTADNITTWKMYAVASDASGKIGVAEAEAKAFQPFFADLEPPKFLTDGDEIFLPVQVRNYTDKKQKTDVSMTKSNWFSFLNPERQQVEVEPNASENAVFGFKAISAVKDGKQKVTAIAAKDSDAIEKPVTVRPNGQEIVKTESKLFESAANFEVNFPANALPKTQQAEVKIYPNLFSHVTESVEGLLQRPYGCGEQTISSTYPNLLILKFKSEPPAAAGGLKPTNSALEQKAKKFLQKGYERLLGYQVSSGGISYWGGKDEADVALTAYAIRFLNDAKEFIEVDAGVLEKAQNWLISQQRADGSWTKKYYYENSEDARRTKLFTSYVARVLSMQKAEDGTRSPGVETALQKALAFLKVRNAEIAEPYSLALFGLASNDAGNTEDANAIAERLETMAIAEGDRVYWNLETNTPFYGWGTPGRIETTALVIQLLIKSKVQSLKSKDLISKGTMFLLKNKDRYGVWYSTQTTVNVLDAFLAALSKNQISASQPNQIEILLNGNLIQNLTVAPGQITPITIDLKDKLNTTANTLQIRSANDSPVMTQVVQSHYIDWRDAELEGRNPRLSKGATNTNTSRQIRLDYKCDRQTAAIMQEISCAVETERVGFKGYGMLLAEIGIPPGADVSRESLQAAMDADWSLSRYDVLPDRIIFYMWSKPGGMRINFKFRPRYGINANTPASVIYDYYNEEAKATVAPLRFEVK